jgi:hypothetical protein
MPDSIRSALSAGVHALVALIVSVLVARGIDIPAAWSALAETAILGLAVAVYVALTHWLATRPDTTTLGRACRWLARILTLGTGALVTVKPKVPPAVQAVRDAKAAGR